MGLVLHSAQCVFLRCVPTSYLTSLALVVLEHGSEKHRQMTIDLLIVGLLEYANNEQGSKSVMKALREGGRETLDKIVKRMCEPAPGYV